MITKVEYIGEHRAPDAFGSDKCRIFSTAELEAVINMALTAGQEGFNRFVAHRAGQRYYVVFQKEDK